MKNFMQNKIDQLMAAGFRAQVDLQATARVRIWKGDLQLLPEIHRFNAATLEAAIDQAFEKLMNGETR
jgi:hypothetical protein